MLTSTQMLKVAFSFGLVVCTAVSALLYSAIPALAVGSGVHFSRALQYEFAGDAQSAIAEYKAILQDDPNDVDAHMRLGAVLLNYNGDVDGAISQYVTALGIDPGCTSCQNQLDDAVDKRNGTSLDALNRGNEFYKLGQLARSVGMYKLALFLDAKNGDAWNSLSWSLYRLGNLSEALPAVNQALKYKVEEPEFINTLACILFDKGDLDGALTQWQKAISRSKKANPADLYGLAIGFLSKGETQRAVDSFKEAIKSDPNYADSKYLRDRIGMSVHALALHDKLLTLAGEPQKEQLKR